MVSVVLRSKGRQAERSEEFHNIDFGLALPLPSREGDAGGVGANGAKGTSPASASRTNLTQRTNVAVDDGGRLRHDDLWRLVPGDIVATWREGHFDRRGTAPSERQKKERDFYLPCSRCGRLVSQINADPPVEACRGRPCGMALPPAAPLVAKSPSGPAN